MIDGAKPRTLDPASVEVHPRGTRVKLEALEAENTKYRAILDALLWYTCQDASQDALYTMNKLIVQALDTGDEPLFP